MTYIETHALNSNMRISRLLTYIIHIGLGFWISSCASSTNLNLKKTMSRVDSDINAAKGLATGRMVEKPIVSGVSVDPTDTESNLAVLLLITRGSSLHACTAVFVKPKVLLTAAHCVVGVERQKVRIVFNKGGGNLSEKSDDLIPNKIVIHEKYQGQPEDFSDLALLKITEDVPTDYIPVKLYTDREKITSDEVLLLGHGITDEKLKDSMVLRKTKKSLIADLTLKGGYFGIDQKSPSGGFCRGDSGAPVFVQVKDERRLFGINSFTVGIEKDRECHTASVAMSASHFRAWIEKNAKSL